MYDIFDCVNRAALQALRARKAEVFAERHAEFEFYERN
jgi:hypothetical protein